LFWTLWNNENAIQIGGINKLSDTFNQIENLMNALRTNCVIKLHKKTLFFRLYRVMSVPVTTAWRFLGFTDEGGTVIMESKDKGKVKLSLRFSDFSTTS
jgi:hypothetical protein